MGVFGLVAASWHAGFAAGMAHKSNLQMMANPNGLEQKSWASLRAAVTASNLGSDEEDEALADVDCLTKAKDCRGACLKTQSECNTAWMNDMNYNWDNFEADMKKCNEDATNCGNSCNDEETKCLEAV